MFLKSLTMRGFKSFAERTTLDFEPGITVIVGPNGSGKSNVVDALSWVLGTRSPKLLRSGELADVIFAGSPNRPALGHASVEITIDNSLRLLGSGAAGTGGSAQEFSEVTISREIHVTGESTYAINGTPCRLLDIEELLSDSGLGRELHTVVGQGQLDEILHAKPEDRRAFIEEAAGILKHRRRRERAERKLVQVDVHLEKLATVLRELKRQLRPLERQAEAASEHATLRVDLRDVRLRIAAHDLARIRDEMSRVASRDESTSNRQEALESELTGVSDEIAQIESRLRENAPQLEQAREAVEHLARLNERLSGTAGLVEARRRHLLEYVEEPLAGRPPDELRAHADRLDSEREDRAEQRRAAADVLEEAISASRDAQLNRRAIDRRIAEATRERAEARERYARFAGEVDARRSARLAAEAEIDRHDRRIGELDEEITEAEQAVDAIQTEIRDFDAEEWQLTERLETAESAAEAAETLLEEAMEAQRSIDRARSSELARADALRESISQSGDAAVSLDGSDGEILGMLADAIRVAPGAEAAVAAALGPAGDALVARTRDAAGRAISTLRSRGEGRATVLPGNDEHPGDPRESNGLVPLASRVDARTKEAGGALAAVRRLLAQTYLVETWEEAVARHADDPTSTFVTPQGDLAGPRGFVGGSGPQSSVVLRAAAAEQAEQRAAELTTELEAASQRVNKARESLASRRAELDAATNAMHASDARITGAAEELARANRSLDELRAERAHVRQQLADLRAAAEAHGRALAELEQAAPDQPAAETEPVVTEAEIQAADETVEVARREELDARLAVERFEEQIRHLEASAIDLRREADEVEAALAEAARRRELRRTHIRRCGELAAMAEETIAALARSMDDAEAERSALAAARREHETELEELRTSHRELSSATDQVREQRHAHDLERAELRRDLEELTGRIRESLEIGVDELAEEHPEASSYDRGALGTREDELVRRIGLLGRVNPLALEEFEALEQRHDFLAGQIEDLRASRRDLRDVIDAVDDKIREVFAQAFDDVAREFTQVFTTVFPGGEGRLVLTDPDDLLTTGIEVEARPPGKRVRRLSLLSGGERSLTALAFLFAIFRARPSPFYVLDEVEAALDDVNLGRLVEVIESFKEHAQLIVVTHQKRTMESADLLYGVTMNEQAVSKVVSERLAQPAGA